MIQGREMIVKKIDEYIGKVVVSVCMVGQGMMCVPIIIENEQNLANSHIEPRPGFYVLPLAIFFMYLAKREYTNKRYFVAMLLLLDGIWSLFLWWHVKSITCRQGIIKPKTLQNLAF